MYRDDEEAARARADAATAEAERLRRENDAMRQAMAAPQPQYAHPFPHQPMPMPMMMPMHGVGLVPAYPPHVIYKGDVRMLPLQERARLAQHTLTPFPTAVTVLLTILTLGLFPWIHLSLKHDSMPKAATDDPGAGKAIGFSFIPVFNLYWNFFNPLRLVDRLNLQLKLRGLPPTAPRAMVLTSCIFWVIPYIGPLLAILIFWPIANGMLQSTINKIAAMPPTSFDATPPPGMLPAYPQQPGHPPGS